MVGSEVISRHLANKNLSKIFPGFRIGGHLGILA
jgi:hypothetical protein